MLQQRRLNNFLQVDDTLLAVAAACSCSLSQLISNHHSRLLGALKPSVRGLHPAVDMAAYVHLLLPWQVAYSACRQAVTGAHTASKVPEYLSSKQQVCVCVCVCMPGQPGIILGFPLN